MFDLKSQITQNHRQCKIFQITGSRISLVPFPFGIIQLCLDFIECLPGNFSIPGIAGGQAQLPESHRCKSIRKDIIRLDQRTPLTIQRKIPIVIPVMTVLFQELSTLHSAIKPFLPFLHFIVKHGKHPHLTALQPDKFIGIKDPSVSLQTSKIPSVFLIL